MGRSVNHKILTKAQFKKIFTGDKSLQSALGLRSRVMPVIGSSISEICNNHMIKAIRYQIGDASKMLCS